MIISGRLLIRSVVSIVLSYSGIFTGIPHLFGQEIYEQVSSTDNLVVRYPTVYAIIDGRIITGSGRTIGKGSIVLRNGLIESVGAGINIPAEARIIEADGLTVYPGFIDVHTTLGFHPPGEDKNGNGQQVPQGKDEEYKPKTVQFDKNLRADKYALEDIDFNDSFFKAARESGITAVLSVNRQGIFPGKGSVITTFVDEPLQSLIEPDSYQFIQYRQIRGGYPNTSMGIIAFQRQTLSDARYYSELAGRFNRSGRGMRNPVFDPVLRHLFPVVRGEETVVVPVNTENEIRRAVRLAREFDIDLVVSGVAEGYRVVDVLADAGFPVILSVNYPLPDLRQGTRSPCP